MPDKVVPVLWYTGMAIMFERIASARRTLVPPHNRGANADPAPVQASVWPGKALNYRQ